jgi:hypothetical protein
MAKKLQQYFVFDPSNKKVIVRGIFNLDQLLLINNVTRGKVLFALGSPNLGVAAIDHVVESPLFFDGHNVERHTEITLNASNEVFSGMLATDELQIFTEDDHVKIEPSEVYTDPVMKMRVSNPQTLIDTDFEYGLQSTKWETLETLNNIPAFFIKNGETSLGDISSVDTIQSSRIITVTTVAAHGLTPGAPFEIRGLNEITAEGTYLVKAVPSSTTFTYEAKATQLDTAKINNSYTVVFPGQFYSASQISIDNTTGAGITSDNEIGDSTLTVNTRFPHGFPVTTVNPAAFYLVNAIAGRTLNFTPQDNAPDGRPVLDFANTFNVDKTWRAAATGNGYQSNGTTGNFVSEPIPGLQTVPQMTGYRNIESQNFEPNSQITVPSSQQGITNITALPNKPTDYGATEHYLKNLYFDWTSSNGSTTDIIAGTYDPGTGTINNTQGFFRYVNHGLRENDIVWLTIGPNANQQTPLLATNNVTQNQLYFVRRIDADRFALKNFVDARITQTIPGTAAARSTISTFPNPVIVTRVGTTTSVALTCTNTAGSTVLTTSNTSQAVITVASPAFQGSLGYGDFNNNLAETPTFEGAGATYTITPGMYVAGDQQLDVNLRTTAIAAYNRVVSVSSNTITLRTAIAAANTNRRFIFYRMFGLFMFQEAATEPIDRNSATKINRLSPPTERFIMNNHYLPDNTRVCLVRLPGFTTIGTAQRIGSATAGTDISGNIIQEIDAANSAAIALGAQVQPDPSAASRQQYPFYYNNLINGANVYYLRRIGTTEDNNEVSGKNLNTGISQIPNGPILSIEGSVDGNFLMLPIFDNPRANQIYLQNHGFQTDYQLGYNILNPGTIATNEIRATTLSNTAARLGLTNATNYFIKKIDDNYFQIKTTTAESSILNIVSNGSNASVNTQHRLFNVAQNNPSRDTIYIPGHSLSSGAPVQYNSPLGETPVGGLQSGRTYFVEPFNNDRIRLKIGATTPTFVDLTSSGVGANHEIVDQSSVGSVDGVYEHNQTGGSDTQLKFNTNSTINGKKLAFDPTKVVDCFISGFLINNHGFLSGTVVTYKNPNGSNDIVPLTADSQYKIKKLSNNAFSLTDMNGTDIILQSPGSNSSPNQPHQFISNAVSGEITGPGMLNLTFSSKDFDSSSPAVVDIGNDAITITAHGYFTQFSAVAVKYEPGPNTPIGGLSPGTIYFVGRAVKKPARNDANDFSLYRTANDAQSQNRNGIVDLTSLGTGVHKLITGSTIVNLLSTGQVLPTFRGNWATGIIYQHGDIVQYRGEFFIAQNYTANIVPTTVAANIYPFNFDDNLTTPYTQNKQWKKLNIPLGPDPKFLQNFKVGDQIRISLDYPQQSLNGVSRIALSATTVIVADDRFSTGTNLGGHGLIVGESVKLTPHRLPIVGTAQAAQTIITTVTSGGGYTTHPTVTFAAPDTAQTPTTALGSVRTRVQFIEVVNGGSGYTSAPTVTVAAAGGTAATATATVEGGQVVSITVTSEGLNMTSVPAVTFTGGGGTGAIAQAIMKVQDVVISNAGAGYHEAPIMTFSEPTGSANTSAVTATGVCKLHTPFIGLQDNLTPNQIFYARPISNAQFELYYSREDAETGTNKIDLQTTGTGDIVFERRYRPMRFDPSVTTPPATPIYPDAGNGYMLYSAFQIKWSGVHGMATGDSVLYNNNFNVQSLDGLTNYAEYFVRAVDLNTVTLHPTRADAINNTNVIEFTNAGISGAQTHFLLHKVFQEQFTTRITGITTNNNLFLQELPTVGLVNCEYTIPTSIYARPDGYTLHRPFDGGVEMTTSASPYSKIARQTRRYFRYQSGKGIQTSVAINFNPPIEIESITSVGTLATVKTRLPHGLDGSVRTVGIFDALTPQNTKDPFYNGTFEVTPVDIVTFTYTMSGTPSNSNAYGFPVAHVTKGQNWGAATRAGMMDDQNGFYFEYDGEKLYCCKRSSVQQLSGSAKVTFGSSEIIGTNCQFTRQVDVSGTIVIRGQTYVVTKIVDDNTMFVQPEYRGATRERVAITKVETTKIPQENWSLDPCDGSGFTGFILDVNKIQMIYMDYSWYGAGKVRFGFKDDEGKVRYVHEFKHNNRRYESYLRSGNLPARYEIEAGGDPQYVPTLFHWGTSVIMDGRFDDDKAYLFTAGSDDLAIQTNAAGFFVPLVTLRLAPSVDSSLTGALGDRDVINRMQVTPNQFSLLSSQAGQVFFFLNGQLTAPNFASAGSPSLSQIIRHSGVPTADGITGGVPIFESRVQANQQTTIDLTELTTIGNSIMGGDQVYPNGPDILTVCIRFKTLTAAANVSATLSWTESQA